MVGSLLLDLLNGFRAPLSFLILPTDSQKARNMEYAIIDSRDINACKRVEEFLLVSSVVPAFSAYAVESNSRSEHYFCEDFSFDIDAVSWQSAKNPADRLSN